MLHAPSDSDKGPRGSHRRARVVRHLVGGLTALLAVGALLAAGCTASTPTPSPATKPQASAPPAPPRTAVATATGPAINPRDSTLPARRIAIARDGDLALIEGGSERVLARARDNTALIAHPRWSPDGASIAYVEAASLLRLDGDWGDDIYVIAPAGGSALVLRPHLRPGEQITGFDWTPDGRALLVGVRQMRVVDGRIAGFDFSVQRYDIASDGTTDLIRGAVEPSVSEDGRSMTYMRVTETGTVLYVANIDGSNEREVTLQPRPQFVFAPQLSPDGETVVFGAPSPDAPQSGRAPARPPRWLRFLGVGRAEAHGIPMEVWRAPVATGVAERIGGLLDDEPRPAWARDGSIFVIGTGALYEIPPGRPAAKAVGPGQFGGHLDVAP